MPSPILVLGISAAPLCYMYKVCMIYIIAIDTQSIQIYTYLTELSAIISYPLFFGGNVDRDIDQIQVPLSFRGNVHHDIDQFRLML